MRNKKNRKQISMNDCRIYLTRLWVFMFVLIFLLLLAQHILGKYNYKVKVDLGKNKWEIKTVSRAYEAWKWYGPLVVPSMLLMLTAWGIEISQEKKKKHKKVDRSVYKFFRCLCFLYLLSISLVILLSPFSRHSQLELMRQFKVPLLILQGVVGISLGIFFVTKKNIWDILLKMFGFFK